MDLTNTEYEHAQENVGSKDCLITDFFQGFSQLENSYSSFHKHLPS